MDVYTEKKPEMSKSDESFEVYLARVESDGMKLRDVPEHKMRDDIILSAVRQNKLAIQHVPEKLLSRDVCIEVIVQACEEDETPMVALLPDHCRTPEIMLVAVQRDARSLEFVREDKQRYNATAVFANGLAIRRIENPCAAVQMTAVLENPQALRYIPLQQESIVMAALMRDGMALEFVKNKDVAACTLALIQTEKAIAFVPYELRQFFDVAQRQVKKRQRKK